MASLSEIEERVKRIFRERLGRDVPSTDADLFEAGALDSLAFVDLLVGVEEELGVRIPVEEVDLEDIRSIAGISRLLMPEGAVP